nr:immunoglobulin heavy chain junction region [Macaca mulatta]
CMKGGVAASLDYW